MMTNDKIVSALRECIQLLGDVEPRELDALQKATGAKFHAHRIEHVRWMCDRAIEFVTEGRREKAMRWLGFIQGSLWLAHFAQIEELKQMNMPDPNAPTSAPDERPIGDVPAYVNGGDPAVHPH